MEFQMLYGIRRDLQEELVKDGFLVRVYVPLEHIGILTLCGVWRNVRRMFGSLFPISSRGEISRLIAGELCSLILW